MRRRPWSLVTLALALSGWLAAPAASAQSGAASRYFLLPGVRVGFGSRAPLHDAAGPGGGFAFDAALVLSAVGGGVVLEVGHQWLQVDEARHDFRWTVAINPVNLLAMFLGQVIGGVVEGVTRGVLSR